MVVAGKAVSPAALEVVPRVRSAKPAEVRAALPPAVEERNPLAVLPALVIVVAETAPARPVKAGRVAVRPTITTAAEGEVVVTGVAEALEEIWETTAAPAEAAAQDTLRRRL